MSTLRFTATGIMLILTVAALYSQVPQTLSYQGMLTGNGGETVEDGMYTMHFNLYSESDPSSPLWSESKNVTVVNGIFNTVLGSVTPLDLPFDEQYYLGIAIGDGEELSPRIALTASAYSFRAKSIDDGQVVKSINNIRDEITIAGGDGVTVTSSSDTLYISATAETDTVDSGGIEIFYSDWFGPNFNGGTVWQSFDSFGGLRVNYIDKPAPEITAEILENSTILLFAILNGYISSVWVQNDVSALPITLMYRQSEVLSIDTWDFRASEGNIRIAFQNSENSYQATGMNSNHRFRYVVFPR
jgi:hypothetical protein